MGEFSLAEHDAAVGDRLVEQEHIAGIEVVLHLVRFEKLGHHGGVQDPRPQVGIVLHGCPCPGPFPGPESLDDCQVRRVDELARQDVLGNVGHAAALSAGIYGLQRSP